MSTDPTCDVEVAVVGAGVVGCSVALALARRRVSVCLLEAEPEPGLGASGTNSGILHTGFDSPPGELETELILASAGPREELLQALPIPVMRCGAVMRARGAEQTAAVAALVARAQRNGAVVRVGDDGTLEVPGEAVTNPVAYTLALAAEANRHTAELLTRFRVVAARRQGSAITLDAHDGRTVRCRLVVNCAGLEADEVARLLGDDSFSIYPRKGEFVVFEPPNGELLDQILLAVPSARTKGVLVFPTLDGKLIAGPTAVDLEDKHDWTVRPQAQEEIVAKAAALYPPLERAEPISSYAGLRPAGRGVNYLIEPSRACQELINVAAIRSTGLTASPGIGERVAQTVGALGVTLGPARELQGGAALHSSAEWWRRSADYRAAA